MKYCRNCAAPQRTQTGEYVCGLFNIDIDLNKQACQHIISPEMICQCDICKTNIPMNAAIVMTNKEQSLLLCAKCSKNINTCATCECENLCDFQTNPINIPLQTQQQINKNGMYMVVTVPNPARIAETCKKNCKCWSEDLGCMKQYNYCYQYKLKEI